jgi:hypothetical protein
LKVCEIDPLLTSSELYRLLRRDRYKKGCYTDIHNHPENIARNIEYCVEVLTKWDFLSANWVQLTRERVGVLKEAKRINPLHDGYLYIKEGDGIDTKEDNGAKMSEYHVDDIDGSADLPELEGNGFGGCLSVRKDTLFPGEREVYCMGHDEATAHEKSLNAMTWLGSKGQQPLRPKDLGTALHCSAFANRQLGWHPKPTEEQLDEINDRRAGTKFVAKEQAIKLFGTADKYPLEADKETFCW